MTTKSSRRSQSESDNQGRIAASATDSPPASEVSSPNVEAQAGFNLRHIVRDVLRTNASADLDVVAKEVRGRIPRGKVGEALDQTLHGFIAQVNTEERARSRGPSAPVANTSWKVGAIRDAWQRRLRDRVWVDGERKFLADCTYDDLLVIAADYEERAKQNSALAREMRALAAQLTEHDAETVSALPVEVQAKTLGRAA